MFAFRHQPLKAAYITFTLLTLPVKLPCWILVSLVPSWRPHPNWTLGRSVSLFFLRTVVDTVFAVGLFGGEDAEECARSAKKLGFSWVDPLPTHYLKGEIASMAAVNKTESTRIYGFWYGKNVGTGLHGGKAQPGEKVLYHFHGGGYVVGSSSPVGPFGQLIVDYVRECAGVAERAFCLKYRLSSAAPFEPKNPFPAALIDALAGYRYLVEELGFKASDVIVSGDSAGGHLVVALVRYLIHEAIPALPVPGAVVLLSPAVDWGCTHDTRPDSTMSRNTRSDAIKVIFQGGYTARALCGSLPEHNAVTNSWISPGSLHIDTRGLFINFPPTIILAGGAEQILDQIKTLYDRLRADNGNDRIKCVEYPEATHDFVMAYHHEPEKTEGAREIARWLGTVYAGRRA